MNQARMNQPPHKDYFEGVLQLRNPTDEVLTFVEDMVSKRDDVFITKEINLKNGVDLYFTSQKFLQQVGKQLKSTFCGELKTSAKLFGRDKQSSKDIYRVNVLFRVSPFGTGDDITLDGDEYTIVGFDSQVRLLEKKTGKKHRVAFGDLERARAP